MTESGVNRGEAGIPDRPDCASCQIALPEPFGWCSNCRAAYCLDCGRKHFCRPACQGAVCIAGLCVRLVDNGQLSNQWGSLHNPGAHLSIPS